jgi:hypothetical protein
LTASGGVGSTRQCTTTSCVQTAGELALVLADLTFTGGPATAAGFRNVVLFNDTPTSPLDPLICWWEYPGGVDVALANGETFLTDFDPAGALAIA